jgi:hypothetical protein
MPLPSLLKGVDSSELRHHVQNRWQRLLDLRQPWLDFCRQVADEILPSRLPYLLEEHSTQLGGERNTHIVDAVGHLALDTAAAGISSGSMPATSEWFDLVVRNVLVQGDDDLRLYLEQGGDACLSLHNQSNVNHILPECQKEWIAFGTGAAIVLEDDEDGFRWDPLTVGQYCIAEDRRGRVDTVYRRLPMTVVQVVEEFGFENVCASTASAFERGGGSLDEPVMVIQAIEPDRDDKNPLGASPDLPWRSVYFEEGSSTDKVLAVRGYRRFPALVWRWGKLPGCAYGYGRGHDVLPHCVRLRKMIYRYGQAMAYKAEPPVQIPAGLQQHEVRAVPGGKTSVFGQTPITNLMRVELELRELAEEIERTRQDIRDTLGATLVASLRRLTHQMTAREADLRTSQDLTEWLPALYRLQEELLAPYIEWLWDIAAERGLLPPAPPWLGEETTIDIEFTSPLARKMREAESEAIVRTVAVAGEFAKFKPEVADNLDVDAGIRRIAEIEGAPVALLVPQRQVQEMRAARQQAVMAEQQAAAAERGVSIARETAEAAGAGV